LIKQITIEAKYTVAKKKKKLCTLGSRSTAVPNCCRNNFAAETPMKAFAATVGVAETKFWGC